MHFTYKNKNHYQPTKRKEVFSQAWFKKTFIISFCLSFCFFFLGKVILFFKNRTSTSYQSSKIPSTKLKNVDLPPLVINLKSQEGPRLTRVIVQIKTNQTSVKKELLSENKFFEKHLLLVLSGQNTKDIHKKRNFYEEKIKTQLNAFLSKGLVNEVHIQTQLIN